MVVFLLLFETLVLIKMYTFINNLQTCCNILKSCLITGELKSSSYFGRNWAELDNVDWEYT